MKIADAAMETITDELSKLPILKYTIYSATESPHDYAYSSIQVIKVSNPRRDARIYFFDYYATVTSPVGYTDCNVYYENPCFTELVINSIVEVMTRKPHRYE